MAHLYSTNSEGHRYAEGNTLASHVKVFPGVRPPAFTWDQIQETVRPLRL